MGRGGGRRNRKRKLPETEESYSEAAEIAASIAWWDERSSSNSNNGALDPQLVFDPDASVDSTDETGLLLKSYYSILAAKYRWKSPTVVQSHVWPHIFNDAKPRNVAFVSATASGKTLVFGLRLLINAQLHKQNGLVLVPTRELAVQVGKNLKQWNKDVGADHSALATTTTTILVMHGGGESTACHVDEIDKAFQLHETLIMVATPGRFLDALESMERKSSAATSLSSTWRPPFRITTICLDEADRLALQMDLCRQIDAILQRIIVAATSDHQQQLCLCSATLSGTARSKWDGWIRIMPRKDCVLIQIGGAIQQHKVHSDEAVDTQVVSARLEQHETVSNADEAPLHTSSNVSNMFSRIPSDLTQVLHVCAEHKKPKKLVSTLQTARNESKKSGLTIIFFNRIKTLQFASKLLQKSQISCLELHSQMPQDKRERAIQTFASGRVSVLLATDVAARGLHIDHVKTVVNYDFPSNLEQYIHRCGRAGRSNAAGGVVYSFFTRNFAVMAKDLVDLLRATKQHVDPNLLELVKEAPTDVTSAQETLNECVGVGAVDSPSTDAAASDNDDSDSNVVAPLDHPGNRIVLRRAGNVSDASSDSDDDDVDE